MSNNVITIFIHIWDKLLDLVFNGLVIQPGVSLGFVLLGILILALVIASIVPLAKIVSRGSSNGK